MSPAAPPGKGASMSLRRTVPLLIAGIILTAAALAYLSPYAAVTRMERAVREKDAAALSRYVNFPALRENLKSQAGAVLGQAEEKGRDDFIAPFLLSLAARLTGLTVDTLVTPEGLELWLRHWTPERMEEVEASRRHESPDRFAVRVRERARPGREIVLVLRRDGLVSWRLSEVRLPKR